MFRAQLLITERKHLFEIDPKKIFQLTCHPGNGLRIIHHGERQCICNQPACLENYARISAEEFMKSPNCPGRSEWLTQPEFHQVGGAIGSELGQKHISSVFIFEKYL